MGLLACQIRVPPSSADRQEGYPGRRCYLDVPQCKPESHQSRYRSTGTVSKWDVTATGQTRETRCGLNPALFLLPALNTSPLGIRLTFRPFLISLSGLCLLKRKILSCWEITLQKRTLSSLFVCLLNTSGTEKAEAQTWKSLVCYSAPFCKFLLLHSYFSVLWSDKQPHTKAWICRRPAHPQLGSDIWKQWFW